MYRALTAAAALAVAACGASEDVRNDDPPPATVDNRCGETGECEGSAPDVGIYLAAACTTWGAATAPGDWDLVDGCTVLLAAASVPDQQAFFDRWLR